MTTVIDITAAIEKRVAEIARLRELRGRVKRLIRNHTRREHPMTTTAKHTATPWRVLPDTHKIGGHPNHLFRFIATANWTEDDGDFSITGEIIAKLTDSQNIAANAAFIVRACNAHDDLLAACKAAEEWFDMQPITAAGSLETKQILRAAIAKAGGAK